MSLLAVICGAEGWDEMAWFGSSKRSWLETWLDLPNGTPCADTFRRVLSSLDPEEFNRCFVAWMAAVSKGMAGEVVAIDGKTLRGSFDAFHDRKAAHVLSAFASDGQIILGHLAISEKSNEIPAAQDMIRNLGLTGRLFTLDAMHAQKNIRGGAGHGQPPAGPGQGEPTLPA